MKAPFPEANIAPIVDYLSKTYGAARQPGKRQAAAAVAFIAHNHCR